MKLQELIKYTVVLESLQQTLHISFAEENLPQIQAKHKNKIVKTWCKQSANKKDINNLKMYVSKEEEYH